MQDVSAFIALRNEPGGVQASGVLADCSFVRIERDNNILKGRIGMSVYVEKNGDAVMIGHPLQVPLHLFRRLLLLHAAIITPQQTPVCWGVGILLLAGSGAAVLFGWGAAVVVLQTDDVILIKRSIGNLDDDAAFLGRQTVDLPLAYAEHFPLA